MESINFSNVALVSIMLANNEIGTIQPIKQLCEIAHQNGYLFHTDATQAIGHIPVDVKKLGVDMLSASAHKFNGPRGIGFLYIKEGIQINSLISGGKQENGLRAGTENVPAIIGMATALKNNISSLRQNIEHITSIENHFLRKMSELKIYFC